MSIEVRIPKEITEYKEKIIFGLSLRQLIFFVLAILVSGGSYFLLTMVFNWDKDLVGYIVIFEVFPLLALGFVRKNGFPFEKYAALIIRHKTGIHKRPYKTSLHIDNLKDNNQKEGTYDWIFKKKDGSDNRTNDKPFTDTGITEKELTRIRRLDRKRKEYEIIRTDANTGEAKP